MRLRSGKIAINNEEKLRRGYVRRMANQNPPNNNGEPPISSSTWGTTVAVFVSGPVSSTTSTTPVQSTAQSGPILSYVWMHGSPVTPSGGE